MTPPRKGPMGPPRTYDPAFVGPWDIPAQGEGWGKLLREWRKARGCPAPLLAQALGLAPRTITSWESSEREPDLQALARLAALAKGGPASVLALAMRQAMTQFDKMNQFDK